ncbi:MAG: PAC2 family protein [Candidatus Woesearchaeota archaeon]
MTIKIIKDWEITTIKKIKINKPILLEGLPGIGNVGKIVADYLIEELDAKKITTFFSYDLPNSVFVNENNLVELPKIELYHKKIKNQDYLFLAGDVQPTTDKSSYIFTEIILNMMQECGCKEIITLGGIGLGDAPDKPEVFCAGNNEDFVKRFLKKGAKNDVYGLVGPIIGISGLLVGMSTKQKIKSTAILAETLGHPMYLGLKGARSTIKLLNKVYGFDVKLTSLNKEIKLMDAEDEAQNSDSASLQKIKKLKEINYIG